MYLTFPNVCEKGMILSSLDGEGGARVNQPAQQHLALARCGSPKAPSHLYSVPLKSQRQARLLWRQIHNKEINLKIRG